MRPYALTIAGFDPSSGAGLTADIKTFECLNVYGLAVCTANTLQHEDVFIKTSWIDGHQVLEQVQLLTEHYTISFAKIGIIENLTLLKKIIEILKRKNIWVIWDPIIVASAGFVFHESFDSILLKEILSMIYLITPNQIEYDMLKRINEYDDKSWVDAIRLNKISATLLKGGHLINAERNDVLFTFNNRLVIEGQVFEGYSKHGTGCVLSAAITSYLSLGQNIEQACVNAKEYIHRFIMSNTTKLGYHEV